MAGEQNVISVIIESVNKMSQDLRQIEGEMQRLGGATTITGKTMGVTNKAMGATTQSVRSMTNMMNPLRSVLVQLTEVTGGFGTALFNLLRFGFTPTGLAITAIIAGTSGLISVWLSLKNLSEGFTKELSQQSKTLSVLNLEYMELTGAINKTDAAVRKLLLSQAEQREAGKESLDFWKSVIEALPSGIIRFKLLEYLKEAEEKFSATGKVLTDQAKRLRDNLDKIESTKSAEDRKKFLLQFVGADEDTVEVGSIEAINAIEKLVNDMEEAARKSKEKMLSTLAMEGLKDSDILEVGDTEALVQIEKIADEHGEAMKKKAKATAEEMADSFVDDFLQVMEGGTFKIENFFANLGRTIVTQFLRKSLSEMLVNPIFEFLKIGGDVSGKGGSIFDIFGSITKLFTGAHGGMLPGNFVPIGPLRKFATGGMAGGPTLGVIGEEGPEIVARMKPARPGDMGGGDITQNIYLVDSRPPRLGPRDIVLYIAADMRAGGKTADAVQNVIKRT